MHIKRMGMSVLVAAIGLATMAYTSLAQVVRERDSTAFRVTLVEGSALERNAAVAVVRRHVGTPHDVIVVDITKAREEDLASALSLMEHLRSRFGDSVQADVRAVPTSKKDRVLSPTERGRLGDYLRYLVTSQPVNVEGMGRVRAVGVRVPKHQFAGRPERARQQ